MPNRPLLPIKVVIPDERRDYVKPDGGGGKRKLFGDVTPHVRTEIDRQIKEVGAYFADAFRKDPRVPAVARVILKEDALAKSHRPKSLFGKQTWPIIGVRDFGDLLVSVRSDAAERLSRRVLRQSTTEVEADLSTIEAIEPYRSDDALALLDLESLNKGPERLKFRLFRHNDPILDSKLLHSFFCLAEGLQISRPEEIRYGGGLRIFRLPLVTEDQARQLASFVGTQSISQFASFHAVQTQAIALRAAKVEDFPAPYGIVTCPSVGIIDSGTNPSSPLLAPWVEAREDFVPIQLRDYSHGSFVAGLICNARHLNHDDHRFPMSRSKIVDVIAMPSSGGLQEDQLLAILETVIPKYSHVKVWNLSLAKNAPACNNDQFSDFAVALDDLQDRYGVIFVLAAGNYLKPPLRTWPPENFGEEDRICPPADSARGITVSALAHEERPNSAVGREEPAPYSRRGPGAAFLPKPDIAHYGGNCTRSGQYSQTGLLSLDGGDNLSEDVGTSFATPLVSTLLANVLHAFQTPPSRCLAKAMLIHSAVLNSQPLTAAMLKYRGFGVPSDIEGILTCAPWSATLVFEPEVIPSKRFIKEDFPIPACLRTPEGSVRGEFVITVVSEPSLDAQYGAEYCRCNVNVSLGTYDLDGKGRLHHDIKVPEMPKDVQSMYERQLVEHGFKWSPVKVYRARFPRGVQGRKWRIVVEEHDRAGHFSTQPTPTAILVTLRDPERQLPVYDEVVRQMAASGWVTEDIQVEERVRMRFGA